MDEPADHPHAEISKPHERPLPPPIDAATSRQPSLPKLDQSKLRETAYQVLRDAFTRGEFAPGDVLNLKTLAEQLGISLTPVREAVRRLVAEGALIDTPSRTLQVPHLDKERVADLKRARLALEPLLADLAFAKMDAADVAELDTILDDKGGSEPPRPNLEQNYAFHFAIYEKAGAPVLLPLVEGLWLQYGSYLNLMMRNASADIGAGNEFHDALVKALHYGDHAAARTALIEDIERSFSLIG